MTFKELNSFPHPDELRANHGDLNWRIYFPNGYGLDIVGGPQNDEMYKHDLRGIVIVDHLYGDGINTFEVCEFKHNLSIKDTLEGNLHQLVPEDCVTEHVNNLNYQTSEQIDNLINYLSNI